MGRPALKIVARQDNLHHLDAATVLTPEITYRFCM